jgi:hypothetical protein
LPGLLVVLSAACSHESDPEVAVKAVPRTDSHQQAVVPSSGSPTIVSAAETPSVSLSRIGMVHPTLHEDVQVGRWSTEVFSDQAAEQLKQLQRLLESQLAISPTDVDFIAHPEFRCSDLVASDCAPVFQDASLHVQRATRPSATTKYHGAAGFADALRQLLAAFEHTANRRASFKVVRVEAAAPDTRTVVSFQLVGDSAKGILQHSATWECIWAAADTDTTDKPPRLRTVTLLAEERTSGSAMDLFRDCTEAVLHQAGSFQSQLMQGTDYWLSRIEQRYGIEASGWHGLAIGDVDGDGLDDLYVCQPGGLPNRLYQQQPDGSARDISSDAGVDFWDHSHAALFLDLDNDGDQDLVVATALGLLFLENDGRMRFRLRATKLCPEAMPFTLAAADYDQDGDVDLFAACYSPRMSAVTNGLLARPIPYHDANNGGRNCLFRNEGHWRFVDVTKQVGLDQNNRRFSLAAAWEDYDNDGDPDLYVANDYGRNNLYRNDGGRFTDVAQAAGVEDISAGMSVSWGDYNGDGQMDLYVSNMWSSAGQRVTYQRQFLPSTTEETRSNFRRHARGNSLFMNMGDGTFSDVSDDAGVTMGRWAWGSTFVDLNNDGREDLVVANGFITGEDTKDL